MWKGIMKKWLIILTLQLGELLAADAIGKVIAVEGSVKAEGDQNRALSRGASIFVSDLITVADAAKIQIKFSDGGLINLISSTQYRVNSYEFKKDQGNYAAELLAGGFRAVSGKIGKSSPENYKVKTPIATMGLRGTDFMCNIVEDQTYFGCNSGEISLASEVEIIVLVADQFTSADPSGGFSDITNERPELLSLEFFESPDGGESFEETDAAFAEEVSDENEEGDGDDDGEAEENESDGEQAPDGDSGSYVSE